VKLCRRLGAALALLQLANLVGACGPGSAHTPLSPLSATPLDAVPSDMPEVLPLTMLGLPVMETRTLESGLTVVAIQNRSLEECTILFASRGPAIGGRCSQAALEVTTAAMERSLWARTGRDRATGVEDQVTHLRGGVLARWTSGATQLNTTLAHVRDFFERMATDDLDYKLSQERLVASGSKRMSPVTLQAISSVLDIDAKALASDRKRIAAVSREEVAACVRAALEPRQTTLVVSGPRQPRYMLSAVHESLASWTGTSDAEREEVPPGKGFPTHMEAQVFPVESKQAHVVLAFDAPSRSDPDFMAFEVLKVALADMQSSIANQALRHEQGLTYGVSGNYENVHGSAVYLLTTRIDGDAINEALRNLLQAVHEVHELKLDPAILTIAQRLVQARTNALLADDRALATLAAQFSLDGVAPEAALQGWLDQLATLNPSILAQAAQRHFDTRHAAILITGPISYLAPRLQWLSLPYTVVDTKTE